MRGLLYFRIAANFGADWAEDVCSLERVGILHSLKLGTPSHELLTLTLTLTLTLPLTLPRTLTLTRTRTRTCAVQYSIPASTTSRVAVSVESSRHCTW